MPEFTNPTPAEALAFYRSNADPEILEQIRQLRLMHTLDMIELLFWMNLHQGQMLHDLAAEKGA